MRPIAAGHTNREIAAALFITPRTAATHVTHILANSASNPDRGGHSGLSGMGSA